MRCRVGAKVKRPRRVKFSGFDIEGLCRILKQGGESGVSELKFGDIHIRYHLPSSSRTQELPPEDPQLVDPAEMGTTSDGPNAFEAADPGVMAELTEQQRLLDDPMAHETLKIDELMGAVDEGTRA